MRRVDGPQKTLKWRNYQFGSDSEKLLLNLQKQTGLGFYREKRDADVWVMVDSRR